MSGERSPSVDGGHDPRQSGEDGAPPRARVTAAVAVSTLYQSTIAPSSTRAPTWGRAVSSLLISEDPRENGASRGSVTIWFVLRTGESSLGVARGKTSSSRKGAATGVSSRFRR